MSKDKSSRAEAYANVVGAAEIDFVRLVKSEFEASPEAAARDQSKWKREFLFELVDHLYNRDLGRLHGFIQADAFCKLGRKKIISVKCRYIVSYRISGQPDNDAAFAFVQRMGKFSAYPYFRSHFSHVTSEAGLMLPPLPIMKDHPQRVWAAPTEAPE
ncbi:hypothetical protein [Caulobacter segnis]|uniref:hypothetical protein n=1 Tax=Caulobacter segnis TaxID=88688 RepID=UPI0026F3005D|nr:hypothetical protein [Caulobacter segnis]